MNNIQKFLRRCSLVCSLLMAALTGYAQESLQSPDGKYTFAFAQKKGQLTYTLSYSDKTIVEQGELGVNIDNHLVESAMGIPVDTNRVWTKGMKVINVSRRAQVCRPPHHGRHSRRVSSYGMEPHLPQPHDSGRNRRQRGRPAQCI